jgi:hypothetical protein
MFRYTEININLPGIIKNFEKIALNWNKKIRKLKKKN